MQNTLVPSFLEQAIGLFLLTAFAVLLGQALYVAVLQQGARKAQAARVLSSADIVRALGQDGVWLSTLLGNPLRVVAGIAAGGIVLRMTGSLPLSGFTVLLTWLMFLGISLLRSLRPMPTASRQTPLNPANIS